MAHWGCREIGAPSGGEGILGIPSSGSLLCGYIGIVAN